MNDTKVKTSKGVVDKMRKIRDQINRDIQNMSLEEIKEYLKSKNK